MKIKGFQKLTLIDYPGEIACTIFLFGCNFRCGFCHNPELIFNFDMPDYDEEDILNFLKKRKGKLTGVCITGGEPLISLEESFVKKIKEMGYKIKIDTNGSNPTKLKEFVNKRLVDYVAMDLKSARENYSSVANTIVDLDKIEESIKIIIGSGIDYEFRTTVVKRFHDSKEIKELGEWIMKVTGGIKPKKYFLQGFKNQGKLLDKDFNTEQNIYEDYLNDLKKIAINYFEEVVLRC